VVFVKLPEIPVMVTVTVLLPHVGYCHRHVLVLAVLWG